MKCMYTSRQRPALDPYMWPGAEYIARRDIEDMVPAGMLPMGAQYVLSGGQVGWVPCAPYAGAAAPNDLSAPGPQVGWAPCAPYAGAAAPNDLSRCATPPPRTYWHLHLHPPHTDPDKIENAPRDPPRPYNPATRAWVTFNQL